MSVLILHLMRTWYTNFDRAQFNPGFKEKLWVDANQDLKKR
jgi:hypothetical protein